MELRIRKAEFGGYTLRYGAVFLVFESWEHEEGARDISLYLVLGNCVLLSAECWDEFKRQMDALNQSEGA